MKHIAGILWQRVLKTLRIQPETDKSMKVDMYFKKLFIFLIILVYALSSCMVRRGKSNLMNTNNYPTGSHRDTDQSFFLADDSVLAKIRNRTLKGKILPNGEELLTLDKKELLILQDELAAFSSAILNPMGSNVIHIPDNSPVDAKTIRTQVQKSLMDLDEILGAKSEAQLPDKIEYVSNILKSMGVLPDIGLQDPVWEKYHSKFVRDFIDMPDYPKNADFMRKITVSQWINSGGFADPERGLSIFIQENPIFQKYLQRLGPGIPPKIEAKLFTFDVDAKPKSLKGVLSRSTQSQSFVASETHIKSITEALGKNVDEIRLPIKGLARGSVAETFLVDVKVGGNWRKVVLKKSRYTKDQIFRKVESELKILSTEQKNKIFPNMSVMDIKNELAKEVNFELERANILDVGGKYQAYGMSTAVLDPLDKVTSKSEFLVMEFARGKPLGEFLEINGRKFKGNLESNNKGSLKSLYDGWYHRLLNGDGIFHEDMHYGNIVMSDNGDKATLIDFGRKGQILPTEQQKLINIENNLEELVKVTKSDHDGRLGMDIYSHSENITIASKGQAIGDIIYPNDKTLAKKLGREIQREKFGNGKYKSRISNFVTLHPDGINPDTLTVFKTMGVIESGDAITYRYSSINVGEHLLNFVPDNKLVSPKTPLQDKLADLTQRKQSIVETKTRISQIETEISQMESRVSTTVDS